MDRTAKANVTPVRQRTQYSCMAASMAMCLNALDHNVDEDEVNRVMGARPMKGAAWEEALACAQHYGCRATLTTPATVTQLKAWTDQGIPVMIAWNPEGRDWSHASVVFDVVDGPEGRVVHVADPNIPNPEKTVRVVGEDDFYGKWYEKWPNYLVRRPALAIEREITTDGRQVVASSPAKSREEMIEKYKHLSRDVREFFGIPPEDGGGNFGWGDGYFFNAHLRGRYKVRDADELVRKLKIDPRDLRGCCSKWRAASKQAGNRAVPAGRIPSAQKVAEAHDCYMDWKAGGLSWEEYQDCLRRFRDDERAMRTRVEKGPVPDDYSDRAKRLALALKLLTGGGSEFKFVKENLYASKLSEKQIRWFLALERKYQRFLDKMPRGRLNLSWGNGVDPILRLSDSEKVKWEKIVDLRQWRGDEYLVDQKKPGAQKPATPSGDPKEKLKVLDALLARRPDRFIQSLRDQIAQGKTLSDNQLKAIRQNLYRNRMREEADLFRMAKKTQPARRLGPGAALLKRRPGAGPHHTREQDVEEGRSRKPKHKKDLRREYTASAGRVAARYLGED